MKFRLFICIALSITIIQSFAQVDSTLETLGYQFENIIDIPHTVTKDQQNAGTCWSYATTSFIESELLRMGKPEMDLSELYFVYYAYMAKAERYVMRHGQSNFSQGGQAHDVMNAIRNHGMVTEDLYKGIAYGKEEHNHTELSGMLTAMLKSLNKNRRILPVWNKAIEAVLQVYLGSVPASVKYDDEGLTPIEFAKKLQINPDDYVEFTSYTNYPLNTLVNLDIPDNWSNDLYYNVSLDDFMEIIDFSLEQGYSIVWDGDVSERGFEHSEGFAVLPVDSVLKSEDYLLAPSPEKNVTEETRLETFLDRSSTDDHLMHLVGKSKDQKGNIYYIIKNSWNSDSNDYDGKLHMSLPFVKEKTVAILLHKDAVPKKIRKRFDF